MSHTIRSKILDYLKKNLSASALELSTVLGVTKPNIQYHVKKLLQENMIEGIEEFSISAEQRDRGRPEKYYRLSVSKTPDNFAYLSKLLLSCLLEQNSSKGNIQNIAGLFDLGIQKKSTPADMLNKAINKLNEYQYAAHWEIHHHGPQIIFKNCPYARLISEFPQLCEMDRLILEKNVFCKAVQINKIDPFDQNPSLCVFQLILNA